MEPHLSEAVSDLRRLTHQRLIPPLISHKLHYLLHLLQHTPPPEDLVEQVTCEQRDSLQSMPTHTQIDIFTTTVSCLSGRDASRHLCDHKAYLRKQGRMFAWDQCYLTTDGTTLTFSKKKQRKDELMRLHFDQLWVSRHSKQYKGKYVFLFYYEHNRHVLGFDSRQSCSRAHRVLGEVVRDRREWMATRFEEEQLGQKLGLAGQEVKAKMLEEEAAHLAQLDQRISTFLLWDQGFKLSRNLSNGRVLCRASDSSVKVSLLIKGVSNVLSIAQKYAQLSEWNSNISEFKVNNKVRDNHFVGKMQTKPYSMLSYGRQCQFSITLYRPCQCRSEIDPKNVYLLIESVPTQEEERKGSRLVEMQLRQLVEFSPKQEGKQQVILIQVYHWADFKGYSSTKDNLNMSLHMLNGLNSFQSQANGQSQSSKPTLFSQKPCPCKEVKSIPKHPMIEDSSGWDLSDSLASRSPKKDGLIPRSPKDIVQAISDANDVRSYDQLLSILKSKEHESYSLKHHFVDKEEVIEYRGEDSRFWQQNGRWTFKGSDYAFVDQQTLNAHKSILKMVLKQIAVNISQGKSVMSMSLPVQIFDRRSLLDCVADGFGFVPHFMQKAIKTKDMVEQTKLLTCALMFISTCRASIEKPFNPILGETYQGTIGGIPIYLEQISHHPPISAYYMTGPGWKLWGNIDIIIDMGLNTVHSRVPCFIQVTVESSKSHYLARLPEVELGGLLYGHRTMKTCNKGFILEKSSRHYCQLAYGKIKNKPYQGSKAKPEDVTGGVFKVTEQFAKKYETEGLKKKFEGIKQQDVVERFCEAKGQWWGNLSFGGTVYKSLEGGPFPHRCQRNAYLLPSDSLFRQDVILKKFENNGRSNQQKERLQVLQRQDRKLREKYHPK